MKSKGNNHNQNLKLEHNYTNGRIVAVDSEMRASGKHFSAVAIMTGQVADGGKKVAFIRARFLSGVRLATYAGVNNNSFMPSPALLQLISGHIMDTTTYQL